VEGGGSAASQIDKELRRERGPEEVAGAWTTCLARWKALPKHRHTAGDSNTPVLGSPSDHPFAHCAPRIWETLIFKALNLQRPWMFVCRR
jgi:hypothetical protein